MAEVKELKDSYGRRLNYLRISVTDRCNYRCLYCMPSEGVECVSHADILRYEDIKFLCRVFRGLGVEKFRFTGGEPLVRRGLVPFLKELREEMPDVKIALTTNASLLVNFARGLAEAGIDSLNVSLDTVDAQKFAQVTRLGSIEDVFAGIAAAKARGVRFGRQPLERPAEFKSLAEQCRLAYWRIHQDVLVDGRLNNGRLYVLLATVFILH